MDLYAPLVQYQRCVGTDQRILGTYQRSCTPEHAHPATLHMRYYAGHTPPPFRMRAGYAHASRGCSSCRVALNGWHPSLLACPPPRRRPARPCSLTTRPRGLGTRPRALRTVRCRQLRRRTRHTRHSRLLRVLRLLLQRCRGDRALAVYARTPHAPRHMRPLCATPLQTCAPSRRAAHKVVPTRRRTAPHRAAPLPAGVHDAYGHAM
jgi:hypothetical protein